MKISQIKPGDVFAGSGFEVIAIAPDIRDRGRVLVTGRYPFDGIQTRTFRRDTNVTLRTVDNNPSL